MRKISVVEISSGKQEIHIGQVKRRREFSQVCACQGPDTSMMYIETLQGPFLKLKN